MRIPIPRTDRSRALTIVGGGSGYPTNATINLGVNDPNGGTGAVVPVQTDGTGAVKTGPVLNVVNPGSGYVAPTGTLSGAATTAEGNNSNSGFSNGPYFADSQTRLTDISDGTSTTLAFGETLGGAEVGVPTYGLTWISTGVLSAYLGLSISGDVVHLWKHPPGYCQLRFLRWLGQGSHQGDRLRYVFGDARRPLHLASESARSAERLHRRSRPHGTLGRLPAPRRHDR